MNSLFEAPTVDRRKEPTEPGIYWGREIWFDLAMKMHVSSWPHQYKVVDGIKNVRNHRLLVETGAKRPHHKSLNCYAWGPPTEKEREFLRQLANQFRPQSPAKPGEDNG